MERSNVLLAAAIVATISFIAVVAYILYPTLTVQAYAENTNFFFFLLFSLVTILAFIFTWVGYGTNRRGFALTAGILYTVAMVLTLPLFYFNIVQMVLCFVAYGTMRK